MSRLRSSEILLSAPFIDQSLAQGSIVELSTLNIFVKHSENPLGS